MTGCKKNGLLAIAARNSTLNSALGRRFQSELCQWRSHMYRSEGGGALEAWGTSASPMREPPIVDRRSHHKPPSGSCRANHRRVSIQVTGTPVTLAPLLPASLAQPRRGRFRFLLSGRSAFYCTNRAAVHTFRGARPMEDIIRDRDRASAHRDRERRARGGGGGHCAGPPGWAGAAPLRGSLRVSQRRDPRGPRPQRGRRTHPSPEELGACANLSRRLHQTDILRTAR